MHASLRRKINTA